MGCPFVSDCLNAFGYHKIGLYFLAEVSNQMLELYEQNKVPPSQGSEVEGNVGGGTRAAAKEPAVSEEQVSEHIPSRAAPQKLSAENREVPPTGAGNQSTDGSAEMGSVITDHKLDIEIRDTQHSDGLSQKDNEREVGNGSNLGTERIGAGDQDRMGDANKAAEVQRRDNLASHKSCGIGRNLEHREGPHGQSPKEAIKMIDKDKVKAALEKRRKARREITLKKDDAMDEDDLIERELEDGVELAVEDGKHKWERTQNSSKSDNADCRRDYEKIADGKQMGMKGQSCKEVKAEEEMIDDSSTLLNKHKRKAGHSPDGQPEEKKRLDPSYYSDLADVNRKGRVPYEERNCRRLEEESLEQ